MKKSHILSLCAFVVALSFVSCKTIDHNSKSQGTTYPQDPDYSDHESQWYITNRNADADIFYIISTETGDYTLSDGRVCNYADTYNDSIRKFLYGEMVGVDALIGGNLNFYSPYYRQCTMQAFVNDSTKNVRLPLAYKDVKRAFDHYIRNINPLRPFVLAGFSQGAMLVIELLKEMDEPTFRRMVAAYVIGASVSSSDVAATSHLVAAQKSNDVGVTICYNSVAYASAAMFPKSVMAINPVNWRTDQEAATLLVTSPMRPSQHDTLSIHLDTASSLLIVDGYTGTNYMIPLIGKKGNYHSREISFYSDCLRDNIALRTKAFLDGKTIR